MEEIKLRYETKYDVYVYDPTDTYGSRKIVVHLMAKSIKKTETEVTFYDYNGCVSGCFKTDMILFYIQSKNN